MFSLFHVGETAWVWINEVSSSQSCKQEVKQTRGEHSQLHTENKPTNNHGHQTTCPFSTADECGADDITTDEVKRKDTTHPFNQPLVAKKNNKKEKGSIRGNL